MHGGMTEFAFLADLARLTGSTMRFSHGFEPLNTPAGFGPACKTVTSGREGMPMGTPTPCLAVPYDPFSTVP
jgi:hypothetical protein